MLIKEPMLTAIKAALVGENLNNGPFKPGGLLKAAAAAGQDLHLAHAAMAGGSFTGSAAASSRSVINPIFWRALINSEDCPDGWENKEPPRISHHEMLVVLAHVMEPWDAANGYVALSSCHLHSCLTRSVQRLCWLPRAHAPPPLILRSACICAGTPNWPIA